MISIILISIGVFIALLLWRIIAQGRQRGREYDAAVRRAIEDQERQNRMMDKMPEDDGIRPWMGHMGM